MSWIKSHQEIINHPKTLDLMEIMGWDVDKCIAKLHRLWWWCVDYAEDGDLRKHNDQRIARAVGLNGENEAKLFVEGMIKARWLDREPYFRVHDWWDHVGEFLKRRHNKNQAKWQAVEALYKDQSRINPRLIKDDTEKRREEERREEENIKKKSSVAKFAPPSIESVKEYANSQGFEGFDAETFVNFYESKGWMVGKNKMQRWHAAVSGWHNRNKKGVIMNGNSYGRKESVVVGSAKPVQGKYASLGYHFGGDAPKLTGGPGNDPWNGKKGVDT